MTDKVLLKDILFNRQNVTALAARLHDVHRSLDANAFVEEVANRFPELELKQRITCIAEALERHLPADYADAVDILIKALPEPCDPTLSDDDFGDFIYAPFAEFVARNGIADVELSLAALKEITTRFSAEDAVRAFIDADPDRTMAALSEWTQDPHYHVRRLTSEGTRPLLPWSRRIRLPYTAAVPILDLLFADPTRYVTRSVANHLNDIAKSDPELVVTTLARWRSSGKQAESEMAFIVRHATRTLVKNGHLPALELLGIDVRNSVTITRLDVSPEVPLGGDLTLSIELESEGHAEVIVDYAVRFAGPTGAPSGRKVFKLKRLALAGGTPTTVTKRHPLRVGMTTRTIYAGEHEVEVLVNGVPREKRRFVVSPRSD